MKINNKGFAISTMLYGILTITIIVMAGLILIMRSNKDMNDSLVDSVVEDLNKCAKKEAALSACYLNDGDCTLLQSNYNSCLGLDNKIPTNGGITPIALLNKLKEEGEQVGEINQAGDVVYYFKGLNPKNYIKVGNKTGRILSINVNQSLVTVKVIFPDVNGSKIMQWDSDPNYQTGSSFKNYYESSTVYNYLNNTFINTNNYESLAARKDYFVESLYENTPYEGENGLLKREMSQSSNSSAGLVTLTEVLRASASSKCALDETSTNFSQCTKENWLIEGTTSWTINHVATNTNRLVWTYSDSGFKTALVTSKNNAIKPVVHFKNITIVTTGNDGTSSKPFVAI